MPKRLVQSKVGKYARKYKKYTSNLSKGQRKAVRAIIKKQMNTVIETKECTRGSSVNQQMPHNNVYIVQDVATGNLNPFRLDLGTGDPHAVSTGNRIGDSIVPKGLLIKGMVEGALGRSKVHFKIMLLRGPQGASFARADIFKGNSGNKLLDQLNTERYKLIASTKFNIIPPNISAGGGVTAAGYPTAQANPITGNKVFSLWVPGKAFGRQIKYENGSTTQVQYFDYRIVIVSYDWYGTPQDVNNVGVLNELYTKLYFKDA